MDENQGSEPGFALTQPRYSGAVASPGKKAARSADEWLLNGSEQSKSGDPRANGTETAQWVIGPASDLGTPTETAAPSDGDPGAEPKKPGRVEAERADDALEEERRKNSELAKRVREMQAELRTQEKEAKAELAKALAERDADLKRQLRTARDVANEQLEQATTALVKKHDSREQRLTKAFEKQREELKKGFEKQQREELKKTSEERETELRARIDELSSSLAQAQKAAEAGREASSRRSRTTTASKRQTGGRKARKAGGKNGMVDLNHATFEELRSLGLSVTQSARVIAYREVRDGYESLEELDEIPGLSKETRAELRKQVTLPS